MTYDFVTADTADRRKIEDALNVVFGMDDAPEVTRQKPDLSPVMRRIIDVMPVGELITGEEIARRASTTRGSVRTMIRNQRGKLRDHGLILTSVRSKGYMIQHDVTDTV